ncbi:MAG: UbiA prenyltransferase family protein [Thermoplasmata archaeon]|nr:UbiA prenyltransferase family protein [Thermoplasmata archaeon]
MAVGMRPGERIRRYLQLGRIMSAMLTAGIAIIGAYSTGHVLSPTEFLVFMWLGFWFHAFGGAYNEISDYRLDSMVKELKDKPLVSGAINMTQAVGFTLLTVFAGILALALFYPSPWPIIMWVASYAAAGYYDGKGKYTPYMFELSLGLTFFFWAFFGAAAVNPSFPQGITINTIAVALVIFIFAVYINWGNAMKDAPTDRNLHVPTRAVAWGYDHRQRLGPGSPHILYGLLIKLCLLVSYALPILYPLFTSDKTHLLPTRPLLFGMDVYTLFFLFFVVPTQIWVVYRAVGRHDRLWWTNYIVADIFLTWLAFSFMTVMVIGIFGSIFMFLLPLLWFAGTTTLMYGKPMRVGL